VRVHFEMKLLSKSSGLLALAVIFLVLLISNLYLYQFRSAFSKNNGESTLSSASAGLSDVSKAEIVELQRSSSAVHDFSINSPTGGDTLLGQPNPKVTHGSTENKKNQSSSSKSDLLLSTLIKKPLSWESFASLPFDQRYFRISNPSQNRITKSLSDYKPFLCKDEIVRKLKEPKLSDEEVKWCRWALDSNGGKVVVGKSWGKLNSRNDKEKFDALNCNSVEKSGKNPSCDDSWGDIHIKNWLNRPENTFDCDSKSDKNVSSKVNCYRNDNNDLYCEMFNAMIDFSKVKKISRGSGMTPSKLFQQNFLSTDCKSSIKSYSDFSFPHLYSPTLSSNQCDVVYNGTLLLYSHDDIRNLGHTLNDVMNIWIMLWLAGVGRYGKNIDMLNIDSFKLGHNFDDEPNSFFLTYYKSLKDILKGISFSNSRLCIKHLLIQPIPPRFFIWESWFVDLPCSFIGPSSLYQRWNFHVRAAYNLLNRPSSQYYSNEKKKIKILMIVRNENSNMWGSQRTSRNYLNLAEMETKLKEYETTSKDNVEIIFQEMSKLSFEQQLELISEVSIMVGMHGGEFL
jgi:hypothetical protein